MGALHLAGPAGRRPVRRRGAPRAPRPRARARARRPAAGRAVRRPRRADPRGPARRRGRCARPTAGAPRWSSCTTAPRPGRSPTASSSCSTGAPRAHGPVRDVLEAPPDPDGRRVRRLQRHACTSRTARCACSSRPRDARPGRRRRRDRRAARSRSRTASGSSSRCRTGGCTHSRRCPGRSLATACGCGSHPESRSTGDRGFKLRSWCERRVSCAPSARLSSSGSWSRRWPSRRSPR